MELIKKIAVLCDYRLIPDRVGGMDRFFWLFDKVSKTRGYEVVWFFPNQANHDDYSQLNIIPAHDQQQVEKSFLDYNQPFDIVFTHFIELCTPFFKKIKQKKLAKQIIVIDHNPRPYDGYPLTKKIKKRLKGILFAQYIDIFIGVSQYTVNELIKDFGHRIKNKTKVIYNGIDTSLYHVRKNKNLLQPKFLVASHLRYSKGIKDLIEAVHLLPKDVKNDIIIDIYGDGPYADVLKAKVNHYQLQNQLVFKGSVSNLNEIYCQYDYMIQPTYMECFSLSILESLIANVPVITTAVGGNEEVVKNHVNGFIVPVKNIYVLANLIEGVFLGEVSINKNISHEIIEKFSLEKMVENYISLIQ